MTGLGLLVALLASGVEPPNTRGCHDKPERATCHTDMKTAGTCETRTLNTPDFSVPGPPTFAMKEHRVCIETIKANTFSEWVYLFGGVAVVCLLVVYNLFRRRSLADYE